MPIPDNSAILPAFSEDPTGVNVLGMTGWRSASCFAIVGNEVPAAWFANGLRVIDIANPLSMKQAAWWMPDVPAGAQRVCSNDVYVDHRGLIYLIDRIRGLSILERV